MIAIDGRETWLIHVSLGAEEQLSDDDRDAAIRTMLGIGPDLDYEVMGTEDWVGRRLVADSLRSGRLFICGDSAHVWVPYAGYGMNAGLADAADPSWLLWAHLRGWAPAEILDAYQRERLPVTDQAPQFAMSIALAMSKERSAIPPHIEENSRRGVAARERLGRELYEIGRGQLCCGGLNFGTSTPTHRSSPTTKEFISSTPCTTSFSLPCLDVECRTSGWAETDRCMTRSDRASRCCALTRGSTSRRLCMPPRRGRCRWAWSTSTRATPWTSMTASWCWHGRTNTWPGGEMRYLTTRSD
jgi:hypothetical protein